MKVSRLWLQKYFDAPLPSSEKIADALTFHAFEVEGVEKEGMDVKVLPNRGADCLSHRGIAKELSAILNTPMKSDPFGEPIPAFPKTEKLIVTADDAYVNRHTGALIRGMKVGVSPKWLQDALLFVGQRSINNVVDVLNYVLLDIGQPSGAFDLKNIKEESGIVKIAIRRAKPGEKIIVLTGETYELSKDMFAFADAGGSLLDIAGIKGGLASGITDTTTDIFLSVGNYDGTLVRKTAQTLKLFTDASVRFQNRPTPELTAYGMRELLKLLVEIAGGEVVGVVDVYPHPVQKQKPVSVSLLYINTILGSDFSSNEVSDIFKRLQLNTEVRADEFIVTPSFERTDIHIGEDLVEEVGRILGYDRVPAVALPAIEGEVDQRRYKGIERMKDMLIEEGFTEVSTQSFAKKGEVTLANPLDNASPALRTELGTNLKNALVVAGHYAPLVLGPAKEAKLFEVGTVFPSSGEYVELAMTERVPAWGEKAGTTDNLSIAKLEDYGKDYTPKRYTLGAYKPFSIYPFVLRDIALFVPSGITDDLIYEVIRDNAQELLVRCDKFDTFEKGGNTSYAFRLVFESMEKTLTDEEVNAIIEKITAALNAHEGWRVR